MRVHSLGYLRLTTPRLERWEEFATDILGLMPVDGPTPDARHYRIDHYPPRLVVSPGGEPDVEAVGFEVTNRRHLDDLVRDIEAAGVRVTEGTAEERARRCVTGLAKFVDPAGTNIELFYGPVLDHVPVNTPLVTGFLTGDLGMGHVVMSSGDFAASYDFYTGVLGFHERNTMSTPIGEMVFLSPNRRHHTLGIIEMGGPPRLVHFMMEVACLDDVGSALDRIAERRTPLMFTLGRHTNDRMVSFYVYTPDGSAVEYGFDGVEVAETATTYAITKPSFWGHHFSPPPALDGPMEDGDA